MKAIITGMNGTVAPAVAQAMRSKGHEVIAWNRKLVPIDNLDLVKAFFRDEKPDCFFHIATGSPDWAELAAKLCAEQKIRFLFTSSVSVFSASQKGPFTVDSIPVPNDDYGKYKLECEHRVKRVNHETLIVRLGWQIGERAGGNHMVDYLTRIFEDDGTIKASTKWFPACSFLEHTAETLTDIMENFQAGLYHLDGNPGLSFFEIVTGLKKLLNTPWEIKKNTDLVQNNLLMDTRIEIKPISRKFN